MSSKSEDMDRKDGVGPPDSGATHEGGDSDASHRRRFTDAQIWTLIVGYAIAQEHLRPRQPNAEFSSEMYSMVRRKWVSNFEIPDKRTYKMIWDTYRAHPERFPMESAKIRYVKAYLRALNCIKSIVWVRKVVEHSSARMPTALRVPEMWVKRQYTERELTEREQEERNKFAMDFHRTIDQGLHEDICFTGQIILKAGASVQRLAYDIFKQKGGGKQLLVIMAVQKSVGLVGPYYFELADGQNSISAQEYLALLKTEIVPTLKAKLSDRELEGVIFQQDGHEYQEHPDTMRFLNSVFSAGVISRHGDLLCWPSWYKDLNPVQYCIETGLMRSLAKRKSIPDSVEKIKVVLDNFFSHFRKKEKKEKAILISANEFSWRVVAVCEHEGEEIEYFFLHFRNELSEIGLICIGLNFLECTLCESEECECLNHHKHYRMTVEPTVLIRLKWTI